MPSTRCEPTKEGLLLGAYPRGSRAGQTAALTPPENRLPPERRECSTQQKRPGPNLDPILVASRCLQRPYEMPRADTAALGVIARVFPMPRSESSKESASAARAGRSETTTGARLDRPGLIVRPRKRSQAKASATRAATRGKRVPGRVRAFVSTAYRIPESQRGQEIH